MSIPPSESFVPSSKLAPLTQRGAEVPRTRLSERLISSGAVKLILVQAPAGFGKTTLMVQLREVLEQRGVATAWLTIDRADNDVSRFLAGLAAAATQIGHEPSPSEAQDVLSQLSAEQAPFALFLDDFDLIREGAVVGLVRELIERLPRNGQLVIGSRSLPELSLSRLRARGQLLEFDAEALRFTAPETAEFFKRSGTELRLEALDRAQSRTEGWVAALWLLSLALKRSQTSDDIVARLSASNRDVADYLSEEVLSQQEPTVREFLLKTSVLHHLSAPVCQALLPDIDCAAVLRALERANVFLIPVEQSPDLYRYHSLFGDFLRKLLLQEQPHESTRLHLAASAWYEAQGRPVPAIDHAIDAREYIRALELLDQHAHRLLEQGRMRLLDRWLSAIPAELLRERPLTQVIAIWARCFSRGAATAMTWLEESGCARSADAQVQAHVRALQPVLLALMDRYEEAHEAGRAGLRHLPSGNSFVDSVLLNAMAHIVLVTGRREEAQRFLEDARRSQQNSAFNRMYTETVGGMLDLREGRLRQASARFRMALQSSASGGSYSSHGNAWAGVSYASVTYECNDLLGAERLLNVYLPLARDVGLPDHMISSYRIRSRLAFQQGDVDTASALLTELEYLGHERQLPRVTASAKLERSRLLALQGHSVAAREELARANDMKVWGAAGQQQRPAQEVDDPFIAKVRIELLCGQPESETDSLEKEFRRAERAQRHYRALKLRLLLALTLMREGDTGSAINEAVPVLQKASQEGFVRLLLDEGPQVGSLIRRVHASVDETAYDPIFLEYLQRLIQLLGDAGTEAELPGSMDGTAEQLTRKEIRILQLAAEGYSNTAMAEKMLISDSTVRTHLRNINQKLNCRSRTQAVATARRLGVIR